MKNKERKALGIYLHIPFCVRKCNYCDFLSAPADVSVRREYVNCLKEEIRQFAYDSEDYQVNSIFFGGGTPSILEGEEIAEIMEALHEKFHLPVGGRKFASGETSEEISEGSRIEKTAAGRLSGKENGTEPEITIECNPGTLTPEKLNIYRKCGINRLSIGLQSAENAELKLLGRIHTWEQFLENFEAARAAGFTNINVDLMSSLPGQTPESWERTLKKVLALHPEHISAYSLIIEEGTPFFEKYGAEDEARARGEETELLPSEDAEREMYYATDRLLKAAGMHRYEISNYAYPGKESVHNNRYWKREEYVGFGLGASSQLGKQRYKNTDSLQDYQKGDYSKYEVIQLSRQDEIEETMYLGLRRMQGVNLQKFQETFGVSAESLYEKQIKKMQSQDLLCISEGYLKLTPLGIDVSNVVLAEFLLE